MPDKSIIDVLNENTESLMSISGVVGTAQGLNNGEPCVKVFVIELTDEMKMKLPKKLDGYNVIIEETGEFKSLSINPTATS